MPESTRITPPLEQIPADLVSISDYQRYARTMLRHDIAEYIDSGVADEQTLHDNRRAFDEVQLYNRLGGDFRRASTQTTVAGIELNSPLLLAPLAHQKLLHNDGEIATARAAAASQVPMICSTLSNVPFAEITGYHHNCWFQLYWQPSRGMNAELLQRAVKSGARALVITLDAPVNGLRNRTQRAGLRMPAHLQEANLSGLPQPERKVLSREDSVIFQGLMCDRPQADDLRWLREQTDLPLFAKGISHPDDARFLKELGFDGLIVSTHGGRTLDGLPGSLRLLPAIRAAVGKDFPVLLDSGIRRGTDIVKAIALGADAVCIGRPQAWALTVAGALGVAHMLRILQQELEIAMALCGCASVSEITADVIFRDGI